MSNSKGHDTLDEAKGHANTTLKNDFAIILNNNIASIVSRHDKIYGDIKGLIVNQILPSLDGIKQWVPVVTIGANPMYLVLRCFGCFVHIIDIDDEGIDV